MLLLQRFREYNNCEHDDFKMIDEKHGEKIQEVSEALCKLMGEHESCKRGKK
jgi:hypothetical protein